MSMSDEIIDPINQCACYEKFRIFILGWYTGWNSLHDLKMRDGSLPASWAVRSKHCSYNTISCQSSTKGLWFKPLIQDLYAENYYKIKTNNFIKADFDFCGKY